MDIEDDYLTKFNSAGYYDCDIENLTQITDEELKNDIKVTKKGTNYMQSQTVSHTPL